jgi:hypothetical protein
MEKIKELIEMKFLFSEFHSTLKEMVVLLTTEEKEATKLEYALGKYTGYDLYSEYGSKEVKFVTKTGKVKELKTTKTIEKKFQESIGSFIFFEEETVYLFATEEQMIKFIKEHETFYGYAGYMPSLKETMQAEREAKITRLKKELEHHKYLVESITKELIELEEK